MIERVAIAEQASGATSTRVRNNVGNAGLFLNVMHAVFGVPFVSFLAAHVEISYPWARPILRDRAAFETRWDSCPHGDWEVAGVAWMSERFDNLDARVMQPGVQLAGVVEWRRLAGNSEATMHMRLEREWMQWRDDEIRAGHTHADALRARLEQRQAAWETTPDSTIARLTPAAVIARERRGTGRQRARKR